MSQGFLQETFMAKFAFPVEPSVSSWIRSSSFGSWRMPDFFIYILMILISSCYSFSSSAWMNQGAQYPAPARLSWCNSQSQSHVGQDTELSRSTGKCFWTSDFTGKLKKLCCPQTGKSLTWKNRLSPFTQSFPVLLLSPLPDCQSPVAAFSGFYIIYLSFLIVYFPIMLPYF